MKVNTADRIMSVATRAYMGGRISIATGAIPDFSSPSLFAAKHPTTLDPLLLRQALGLTYSALITEAAFRVPIVRSVLAGGQHLSIGERGNGGTSAIEAARALATAGRHLAIFPEGCLSPDRGLKPLHSGAVRIAAAACVPVVPVGIAASASGTREMALEIGGQIEHGRFLLKGWYVLRIGKALRFDCDPEDRQAVREGTARLARAIRVLSAEAESCLAFIEGRPETGIEDPFVMEEASS